MLKEQIKADVTDALKSRNSEVATVLRSLLASISTKEKDKRYALSKDKPTLSEEEATKESTLTDEETMTVVSSEIKKRRDAVNLYETGNRPELAEQEKKEIAILQKYLPEQLSADELRKVIEESIASVGAKDMKDMGKIMADIMPKVKGKAEGSEISKIIKEILSK